MMITTLTSHLASLVMPAFHQMENGLSTPVKKQGTGICSLTIFQSRKLLGKLPLRASIRIARSGGMNSMNWFFSDEKRWALVGTTSMLPSIEKLTEAINSIGHFLGNVAWSSEVHSVSIRKGIVC